MKHTFFISIAFLCISLACSKETNSIPYRPVRLNLDTNLSDKDLRIVGGYKTYTKPHTDYNPNMEAIGYGGVLVVHAFNDQFYAYDLACPYEANPAIRVEVDELSLSAVCPKCKTSYDVFSETGFAAPNGVGKEYLKRYEQVMVSGTKITVVN